MGRGIVIDLDGLTGVEAPEAEGVESPDLVHNLISRFSLCEVCAYSFDSLETITAGASEAGSTSLGFPGTNNQEKAMITLSAAPIPIVSPSPISHMRARATKAPNPRAKQPMNLASRVYTLWRRNRPGSMNSSTNVLVKTTTANRLSKRSEKNSGNLPVAPKGEFRCRPIAPCSPMEYDTKPIPTNVNVLYQAGTLESCAIFAEPLCQIAIAAAAVHTA